MKSKTISNQKNNFHELVNKLFLKIEKKQIFLRSDRCEGNTTTTKLKYYNFYYLVSYMFFYTTDKKHDNLLNV